MRFQVVVVLLVALVACKGESSSSNTLSEKLAADKKAAQADPPKPAPDPAAPTTPPTPPPAPAQATAVAAFEKSPEALWDAYAAAHVGATPANAVATGKKIWPMLGADAQKIVRDAVDAQMGKIRVTMSAEDLAYKLIGEAAGARADLIGKTPLSELKPENDRQLSDGSVVGSATLRLRARGHDDLVFAAERIDNRWHFAPSPALLPTDNELFKMPATGKEAPAGAASADAAIARWKQVIDAGNGWDAYNLMSPPMRKRLLGLIAQMGGNGAEDVVKVFEKTIVDRRNRGIHVKSSSIDSQTDTTANFTLSYSDGTSDKFHATRTDGAWWIEMDI